MGTIKIGIVGYGNVGKGAEKAVCAASDMELCGIFTRRDASGIHSELGSKIYSATEAEHMKSAIDVMILCGGSATDLKEQGPMFAADFNIVDSFDTHANIPEYIAAVNESAKKTAAVISAGWDPGLFSMLRALSESVLPSGAGYTFWGRGVSQGHSDAIRRIAGVKNAVQYTVPIQEAVDAVRSGVRPQFTAREKHLRECYVVAEKDADLDRIAREIKQMPNYFEPYDTTVEFITDDEFKKNHSKMPHGGSVIHTGDTGKTGENKHVIEYTLKLDSNPEFTGSVLAAYARAAYRLAEAGEYGAKTVLDIPLSYLSPEDRMSLITRIL